MKVVKIIKDEDGESTGDKSWHFIMDSAGAKQALCNGQVFGEGIGSATVKFKQGKITCKSCIEIIKMFQSITL